MKLITTSALTPLQQKQIAELVQNCCNHDQIHLSYPLTEQGGDCVHALLYQGGRLIAVLSFLLLDEFSAECCAFTLPEHRQKGYFFRLFRQEFPAWKEYDILFCVDERCAGTMAVLRQMEAELDTTEYQMEREIASGSSPDLIHPKLHIVLDSGSDASDLWHLYDGTRLTGQGILTCTTDSCACLHHLEILPDFRRLGYGSDFLTLLTTHLSETPVRKLLLQVSAANTAAVSLYQKTGFRITETLSYYLY